MLSLVERAICLLGNASNSLSVLRRSKILYAINPAKISLAEASFPNAGKQLFGSDISKIAADSAEIVRNLQKNLHQQRPQTPSWSKPQFKKYQSKNEKFRPTPSPQIATLSKQRADFHSSRCPFGVNNASTPINSYQLSILTITQNRCYFCYNFSFKWQSIYRWIRTGIINTLVSVSYKYRHQCFL